MSVRMVGAVFQGVTFIRTDDGKRGREAWVPPDRRVRSLPQDRDDLSCKGPGDGSYVRHAASVFIGTSWLFPQAWIEADLLQ